MPVYFMNDGEIDLDTIRIMGISAKETENPIGYFGTGLKYAIATLLRNNHSVKLFRGNRTYNFTTEVKEIRGKTFSIVLMNDEQLGFTTDLGKNWQLWQAYRELYANCLDENGSVSTINDGGDTVFMIDGEKIMDVHADRGSIFLHGEPWLISDGVEIHRGKSNYIYYRGVRVFELPIPSAYTYNILVNMNLTEDRTFASTWDMNYKLGNRIPRITNPDFCETVVNPTNGIYENALDFTDCYEPSEEFLDALEKHRDNALLSSTNLSILKKRRNVSEHVIFTLSETDTIVVREACDMLRVLNCYVNPSEIIFVESLGPNILAQAKDGKIIITRQCLANGRDMLAITIYEEWIHNKMGYQDESRGMQQFLFDKILELIKVIENDS